MLLSVIGLGRVSDYAVRTLQCPVCVVKHKPKDLAQATRSARSARVQAENVAAAAAREEDEAVRRRQRGV